MRLTRWLGFGACLGSMVLLGAPASAPAGAASPPDQAMDSTTLTNAAFGEATVGSLAGPIDFVITNDGLAADDISGFTFGGTDPDDFLAVIPDYCSNLQPAESCDIQLGFLPGALGPRSATGTVVDTSANPPTITMEGTGTEGYYVATANGAVHTFGDATSQGDASTLSLKKPIVGLASTGSGAGYWLVASDGGIFNYGDAGFEGSAGALPLNKPIVGLASTGSGAGYWLVASDGGIFNYGDAGFDGSAGGLRLNKPIVGLAPTPDGGGYWLVASDGGIFNYGDAGFFGSAGSLPLNAPIVGMAPTPDGRGYWLVASDGGVFAYGDAAFFGSAGSLHLNAPIVGMAPTPDGGGYWFVASDGGVFNYGDAPFYGSAGAGSVANAVALASTGGPTLQAIVDAPAFRTRVLQHFGDREHGYAVEGR
jgi:hypothetical protein